MKDMDIWVYPGSFDPITNGHLDIITRASRLCSKLIVAVGNNSGKNPSFSVEERLELIRQSAEGIHGVEAVSFSGLLADFMKKIDTNVIGKNFMAGKDNHVDNKELIEINAAIRYHDVEIIGEELREAMTSMKAII